ncbi:MAG: HNH endonuclease family protein [Chloroflexota bacterium]|nr:HNH endonuclease family protein [Chloroflexota bacterium]MDE2945724.1 HNH endonuclease family protein [Chloroflexota bacterium]
MNIRGRPSASAPILGTTPPGEGYAVVASHQGDVYCWLNIDLGWIAVTQFVSPDKAQARASGSSARSSTGTASPVPAQPAINAAVQGALNRLKALVVAREHRCSPYDRDDYSYPQSVEPQIVNRMGGRIYGPYTGALFSSTKETDIEHIVAASEAHDSGLCGAGARTRKAFARDLLNLTLASPSVNRHQKSGKDFAEWRPALNKCWFADRVIKVKTKYKLTIDSGEKAALQRTLASCPSVEMR